MNASRRIAIHVLAVSLGVLVITAMAVSMPPSQSSTRSPQASKNPYSGQASAAKAGRRLFVEKCAQCHGQKAEGTPTVPALAGETTQSVPEGVLFAYITRGDKGNGMPSWASLPKRQRWQIVTNLKSLSSPPNSP